MKWSLISLLFISTTLSDGIIIDLLFIYINGSSLMEWPLISFLFHINDPLWWNGHWSPFVYIKAISNGMAIDPLMFILRPFMRQWPSILFYIKSLSNGMVNDFSMFISRPSTRQWSSNFFHINALSDGMVIDLFMFISRPSTMIIDFLIFMELVYLFKLVVLVYHCFLRFFRTRMKLVFLSSLIFYFDKMKILNFHVIK